MEKKEPEYWTYELVGGQFDGDTGRQASPRTTVCRPSRVDRRMALVYHCVRTHPDQRHAVYRYHHDTPAVLATEQPQD